MEKFLAEYDPLAALDAEYAAVVAQTRAIDKEPVVKILDGGNQTEKNEQEPAQSDEEDADDDDDSFGGDQYAMLPTSPVGSGDGFDDEEDEQDSNVDDTPTPAQAQPSLAPPAPMDSATKQSIMASMQNLHLQPPPWATDRIIEDDELIELVQKRLRSGVGVRTEN